MWYEKQTEINEQEWMSMFNALCWKCIVLIWIRPKEMCCCYLNLAQRLMSLFVIMILILSRGLHQNFCLYWFQVMMPGISALRCVTMACLPSLHMVTQSDLLPPLWSLRNSCMSVLTSSQELSSPWNKHFFPIVSLQYW